MKRFSIIEYGNEVNLSCGAADKYVLQDYEPLLNLLATLETTEEILVKITVCEVNDGEAIDRDLAPEELDDLMERFIEFKEADLLSVTSQFYYKLHGVLTEPFEDYYQLEGQEREDYLKMKKELADSREQMIESLRNEGKSEDEIQAVIAMG